MSYTAYIDRIKCVCVYIYIYIYFFFFLTTWTVLKWYVCRATGEKDVTFKILYCGICHSDLYMVKNEWGVSTYPLVPGYVS